MTDEQKGTGASSSLRELASRKVEVIARKVGLTPGDRGWVTLDVGATLFSLSPKLVVDFFKAVRDLDPILENGDLRAWAELGRRIAQHSPDEAAEFLPDSAAILKSLSPPLRSQLIALSSRQIVLSPAAALATFRQAPQWVRSLGEESSATRILAIAVEVAHRSVKHSAEVLTAAPLALTALHQLEGEARDEAIDATLSLAEHFAQRTGATAAEFLTAVGEGLAFLARTEVMVELCHQTRIFLERGGATALQYFRSARTVLVKAGVESFTIWNRVTHLVAAEGNAVVYDFLKLTPKVIGAIAATQRQRTTERVEVVLKLVEELVTLNVHVALECFKSSPRALAAAGVDQFLSWAREGAVHYRLDRRKAQAYFALESRTSQERLQGAHEGVPLDKVSHLLRLYVEGLTGREMAVVPLGSIPEESRITDGQTIQLPSVVAEFGSPADDFRLYKVLAAHAAGQIEFGTRDLATPPLQAALREVENYFAEREARLLAAEAESGDEFAQYSNREHLVRRRAPLPSGAAAQADYKLILSRFPNPMLATRIFTTLENGRVDWRLRATYRGIRRDLDFVRDRLIDRRPPIVELTAEQAVYEMLFQITLCGGVIDEIARRGYAEVILPFERIVSEYLRRDHATVAETLVATLRVYQILESPTARQQSPDETDEQTEESDTDPDEESNGKSEPQQTSSPTQHRSDFLNQWSQIIEEASATETDLLQELLHGEMSEQELLEGDEVFFYDEWDRELGDHRAKWCRVIQRENRRGSREFVDQVRQRYSGVISSIRHQFQMLRPESLRKIKGELDGEDFDLQAVVDYHVDKRTTGRPSDRLYIRRIRRERDVAVSFLLDMSSSTARTISRHPNQPYTRPGQKIIDIEKQGLVLMSEALEAVGDAYAISGFSSEGRRNVKYFQIKRFDEPYRAEVERRIGGITYHNNTRLGAAIRHAAAELEAQEARTRLLIVLSDGRPYDHDYGDSRYAREDTKVALRQAKARGITPFCITIDRDSESELKDLYGEVGYTIIDDVMSLPERLPGIYRRLTT
jgi:nitric oxide reductase NorD protein